MQKNEQKNQIISFYKKHKRMPGYKEIMDLLGFKSKNSVHKLINWLVDEGVVSKDLQGRIVPIRLEADLPFVGLVEAGLPDMNALEQDLDTISIEDFLVEDKNITFVLEVKGDSMIDAHIEEGDLVLVERKGEPKDGDIVIAEVDGGWTMKYYRKRAGKIYLEPANKKYKPIYPTESLNVAAIVKAVIRKY